MYNSEIKQRFIEEKRNLVVINEGFYENIFSKTEKYELELNKDVSCFSFKEITGMYKLLNIVSYSYLANINSALSSYTLFCIHEGIVNDCQNHFSEISSDVINSCLNALLRNMQLATREEVLRVVSTLINPKDQFCLLALFEYNRGREYIDICELRIEDVDVENLTANLPSGRTVMISKELADIATKSAAEYVYYGEKYKKTLVDEGSGTKVFKNFSKRNASKRSAYNSIIKSLSYFNASVTPNSLVDSGRISFILRRATELNITAKDYIYKHADEIENQFNANFSPSLFLKKFGGYL